MTMLFYNRQENRIEKGIWEKIVHVRSNLSCETLAIVQVNKKWGLISIYISWK